MRPEDEQLPLTPVQAQLWFAETMETSRTLYTESGGLRLTGPVDRAALGRAVLAAVARHEALRTVVPAPDGVPVMRVLPPPETPPLTFASVLGIPPEHRDEATRAAATDFVERAVDLAEGPLLRALLIDADEGTSVFVLACHHVVCDATSAALVLDEIVRDYEAFTAGRISSVPEPALQFGDFAVWERDTRDAAEPAELAHWRETLRDAPDVLDLGAGRPRPPRKGTTGTRVEFRLGDDLADRLLALARRHRTSGYVTALAAFAGLVARRTGRDDFLLGTMVPGRDLPELEQVVGQFANTVPVRLDASADPDFEELIRRTGRAVSAAAGHGRTSLGRIVETALPGGSRSDSRNALLQHLFLPRLSPVSTPRFGAAAAEPFEVDRTRGRLDTITEIDLSPGRLRAWVEYDTELFTADEIGLLFTEYAAVLRAWAEDPAVALSALPVTAVEPVGEDTRPEEEGGARTPSADSVLLSLVREVWARELGLPDVGPDDDFFVMGGHSMLSAKLVGRLGETFAVRLPLRTLFENPTPALLTAEIQRMYPEIDELVRSVAQLTGSLADTEPAADAEGTAGTGPAGDAAERLVPLAASQLQIWLAEQKNPGTLTHTVPMLLTLNGPLDTAALRGAVADVVARQEALRSTFVEVDAEPRQRIVPHLDVPVPLIDLSGTPSRTERAREAARLRQETAHTPLDLENGPLLKVRLVRLGEEEHVLHLLFHHLVTDEVSMTLFMRELSEFYRARTEGRAHRLPPLTTGMADIVADERAMLAGPEGERLRRYWVRRLTGARELRLDTDRPRTADIGQVGEFLQGWAPGDLLTRMSEAARERQSTVFTVFLTAVLTVLHRLSGENDIVIGVPCENRTQPGADRLMGCFLNVLPLRVDCSGDPTFAEFQRRVGERLLDAYDHQRLPVADIVDALRPVRSGDRQPLFQVTCELQLALWMPLDLPDITVEYELVSHGTARYEMSFHGQARPDRLSVALELNTGLWSRETGLARIDDVLTVLRQATAEGGGTTPLSAFLPGRPLAR
ncbi:condensation domain-containing protein [Streptomyces sp. enrichment culture]|uniref:condensation domain-containing protein n=1 Tax=Streptomyces sp. enrichment culture TaxID=1795815 RepID=UPI003F55A237